jgi:hypothetical protein
LNYDVFVAFFVLRALVNTLSCVTGALPLALLGAFEEGENLNRLFGADGRILDTIRSRSG